MISGFYFDQKKYDNVFDLLFVLIFVETVSHSVAQDDLECAA